MLLSAECVAKLTYPRTAAENCSFPFTYDGVLHYSCMQNEMNLANDECKLLAYCLIADRVIAICNQSTGRPTFM